jgi:hypothetical protein
VLILLGPVPNSLLTRPIEAYAEALAAPGKSSPAKVALEHLKELSKKRAATIGIATYATVDLLDVKHDKTDQKIDYVSSMQINIYSQMKQMLSEKREDKAPPKSEVPKHRPTN